MRKVVFLVGFMVCAVVANAQGLKAGDVIDNIKLLSTTGTPVDLAAAKTKGYIVVFMTPDCDSCTIYRDRIKALHAKYERKGYPVVAISGYSGDPVNNPAGTPAAINKWMTENEIKFTFLADDQLKYTKLFGVTSSPQVVLLTRAKTGGFSIAYTGPVDDDLSGTRKTSNRFVEQAIKRL